MIKDQPLCVRNYFGFQETAKTWTKTNETITGKLWHNLSNYQKGATKGSTEPKDAAIYNQIVPAGQEDISATQVRVLE